MTAFYCAAEDCPGNRTTPCVERCGRTPAESNRLTLEDRATQALAANATFLALASPTNAQTLAQVRSITRQNSALIRLLLGRLDGTD